MEKELSGMVSGIPRLSLRKKARIYVARPPAGEVQESTERERTLCEGSFPTLLYGTEDFLAKRAVLSVFSILPSEVRREVEKQLFAKGRSLSQLEEIRLCRFATSSFVTMGEEYSLPVTCQGDVLFSIVKAICHGAPFSYREEMAEGYLPFDMGVRVGVVGACRYTIQERVPAIHEIHTLTFRIPHSPHEGEGIAPLVKTLKKHWRRGCLIVSPPRIGKTTMLRMLSRAFSVGEEAYRVAVVDTRCEFFEGDFAGARMDVLTGVPRGRGATIALRTLSPDILAMDEIGGEGDVQALCDVMRAGVLLLATAHAKDIEDIQARPLLSRIVSSGVFDTLMFLSRTEGRVGYRLCSF